MKRFASVTIAELFENRPGFETPTLLSLSLVGRSRLLFSLSPLMPKIHYTRFSVTIMKLLTCYGLIIVSDTANKSATCHAYLSLTDCDRSPFRLLQENKFSVRFSFFIPMYYHET